MARRSRAVRPALRAGQPEGQQPPGGGDRRRVGGPAPPRLEYRVLAAAAQADPAHLVRHGARGEVVVVPRARRDGPRVRRRRPTGPGPMMRRGPPTATGDGPGSPLRNDRHEADADQTAQESNHPADRSTPAARIATFRGRTLRTFRTLRTGTGASLLPHRRRSGPATARHPASGQRLPPAGAQRQFGRAGSSSNSDVSAAGATSCARSCTGGSAASPCGHAPSGPGSPAAQALAARGRPRPSRASSSLPFWCG